jgi:RNA polymerase sigma-70 factor (ECF subfamily)
MALSELSQPEPADGPHSTQWFVTTHWSVVLAAKAGDSPQASEALERLCRTYWRPLYAFIRRDGYSVEDAQDLTQEFLARLLAKDYLDHLQHQQGKFRSFLLTFLKHFLSDQRDRARAQKRGGGRTFVSLDQAMEEEKAGVEPVDGLTADQIFDRRWASALLAQAVARLRQEYVEAGRAELFEQLKDLQPGERGAQTYAELGARLGLSEASIKSAAHRLRQRHQGILREEIANTVTRPEDVEDEIRHLLSVLTG